MSFSLRHGASASYLSQPSSQPFLGSWDGIYLSGSAPYLPCPKCPKLKKKKRSLLGWVEHARARHDSAWGLCERITWDTWDGGKTTFSNRWLCGTWLGQMLGSTWAARPSPIECVGANACAGTGACRLCARPHGVSRCPGAGGTP